MGPRLEKLFETGKIRSELCKSNFIQIEEDLHYKI